MSPQTQFRAQAQLSRLAMRRAQRGWTMVELMFALALVAVMLAGVFYLYSLGTRYYRESTHASDIQYIVGRAQSLYGSTNLYGSVTTTVAVKDSVLPRRVPNTDTAQSIYNGLWSVAPTNLTSSNDTLSLTDPNVRASDCSGIVHRAQSSMRRITVGSTVVKTTDAVDVDTAALATACDTGTVVTITWDIGRSA